MNLLLRPLLSRWSIIFLTVVVPSNVYFHTKVRSMAKKEKKYRKLYVYIYSGYVVGAFIPGGRLEVFSESLLGL